MVGTSVTVLVIGPAAVSGGEPVPDEMVCAAIDAIDDRHALVEDRVVDVDALWASVIAAALPHPVARLTLVCPGWWSDDRVTRIRRAVGPDPEIVIRRRHEVDGTGGCRVEIAREFVLCRIAGRPVAAVPRSAPATDVARAVVAGVDGGGPVLIDVPARVAGATELAAMIARGLREHGREVGMTDDAALCAAVPDDGPPGAPARRGAGACALLTCGALLAAGWLVPRAEEAGEPVALITEGRVTVRLPAGWMIDRVTGSAGSPRVQADSPSDQLAAILLTQSPAGPDPGRSAAVLKAALERQPEGVFTDFRTDDHRGGRAVSSYTEIRGDREIAWAVFIDGPVRIAIGCQQPAGGGQPIREHCDEAIRSARGTP
ncbi:type VII secretion-associated protein [Mycolicibacterium diernhoferi]|uniref:Type VII secretion-associated protein n=2 Tax=Mycolicibacterium diernhoferi TaxID=1801 RepID=A0A2A7NX97_9MYCO|nr:type VII secretion-associated protein [Mycolicibacterium diernhoferi]PEG54585.1 type VII secretion-associated protein [Mycolicibacterium diernhoferi]